MDIIVLSHSIVLEDYKNNNFSKEKQIEQVLLTCDVFLEYVAKATGKTEQLSFLLKVKRIVSYPDNVTMKLMKIEHNTSNKS